jgi:hypothetical protein
MPNPNPLDSQAIIFALNDEVSLAFFVRGPLRIQMRRANGDSQDIDIPRSYFEKFKLLINSCPWSDTSYSSPQDMHEKLDRLIHAMHDLRGEWANFILQSEQK